jgi:hypothetical protein
MRRSVGILGVALALASALPGCGDGMARSGDTTETGEIKIEGPVNPAPKSTPVQEEYKNMDPAGQVGKIR